MSRYTYSCMVVLMMTCLVKSGSCCWPVLPVTGGIQGWITPSGPSAPPGTGSPPCPPSSGPVPGLPTPPSAPAAPAAPAAADGKTPDPSDPFKGAFDAAKTGMGMWG